MRTLYHYPLSPQSRRVRVALAEKGLEFESVIEQPWRRREEFLALNPAGEVPVLAVRLQEMFGCATTPTVAGGRVPVLLHLLSPAQRPLQVTRDLAGFWASSYHAVKKDMKGQYPKHHWPDDPLQAEPTRRAKPRGQ